MVSQVYINSHTNPTCLINKDTISDKLFDKTLPIEQEIKLVRFKTLLNKVEFLFINKHQCNFQLLSFKDIHVLAIIFTDKE